MNKGFKLGTEYIVKEGKEVKHYDFKGESVKVTLDNEVCFICGVEQELFTNNNELVLAKDSLITVLYNEYKVVNVEILDEQIDLFDITVDNDEHSFYVIINGCEIKVHNIPTIHIGTVISLPKIPSTSTGTSTNTTVEKDTTIYIPQTDIIFNVSRMKPNTRLYAFFDGKDVTDYIYTFDSYGKPESQSIKVNPMVTDGVGDLGKYVFRIPNNDNIKFVEGPRIFKLTDSPTNGNSETSATATYLYTGNTENASNPNTNTNVVYEDYMVEPTIQSFYCYEKGGMYVSKIGLFFYSKDNNESILFQIREVSEDKVSNEYIGGTSVTLYPKNIVTSTDPLDTTPTWVTFDSPVYLSEGKEYCIYMITNSSDYILHMVDYGQQTNNITAARDLSSRSLIKHTGVDSWVRDNSRGLKYILQKCKFDTANNYTINLANPDLGLRILPDNSLSTYPATQKITVTDPDHSFSVGGMVEINCELGDNITDIGGWTKGMISCRHRITEVTWNTYSFDNFYVNDVENKLAINTLPGSDNVIFGKDISTDFDIQYDDLVLNANSITLTGSDLKYQIKGMSGKSLDGSESAYVIDNSYDTIEPRVDYKPNGVKKVASQLNSRVAGISGDKSFKLKAVLSTSNENISPVVDKYNVNIIAVENLINNQVDGYGDNDTDENMKACARRIFKSVNLYESATGLKVSFLASVQPSASLTVYYKTLDVDSNESIDNNKWQLMNIDSDVTKSLNADEFYRYNYTVDKLNPFKAFKVKIVMNSSDSTKVPLISKFASIAFIA